MFYMLISIYFTLFKKIFLITLFVQNCNFSHAKKKILLQHLIQIQIEYIRSKTHVIRDEVLCRLFKTILAD